MASILNADTSDGLKFTSDTSGEIKLQSAGTDIVSVTANGMAVDTNTLYVDATNNRVGVGTSSPDFKVEVVGGTNNGIHIKDAESATVYGGLFTSGTPSLYLVARSNHPLNFGTNDIERMRILSGGNVCIGTTAATANAQLTVARGGSSLRIAHFENTRNLNGDECLRSWLGTNCNNTTSYHYIASTGGADKLYILGNGNVQNSNNSYGGISDVKLKENIVDATPKLDDLMQVRVRNYNLIGDDKKQLGVVAQELEQIFPNMVDELPDRDEEGNQLNTTTKSVKYSVFVPMLIKAIQEQQDIINALETRIQALENA